jgi:hypothetical protein
MPLDSNPIHQLLLGFWQALSHADFFVRMVIGTLSAFTLLSLKQYIWRNQQGQHLHLGVCLLACLQN